MTPAPTSTRTILSVVGTRPELVQAAPVSRALRGRCRELILHTGQHYDANMSGSFFAELELSAPEYELGVGSGSHAEQTARILTGTEDVLRDLRPDLVLVRGDTNSTLAAALAAVKLGIPVAHVEAGVRSYNRAMPEEINRLVVDRISSLLFCPTAGAVDILKQEGIGLGVHLTGDVSADAIRLNLPRALARGERVLADQGVRPRAYLLTTVHRPSNTDDVDALREIVSAFATLDEPIVFAVHPRTAAAIERIGLALPPNVRRTEPLAYLDMLALLANARLCMTDSGGLQKESYLVGTPCLTLRDDTEWTDTVAAGWSVLVGSSSEAIVRGARELRPLGARPPVFGDGHAAERIADLLLAWSP